MTIPNFQIPNFASPVILGQPESLMDRLLRLRKAALDQNLAGLNTPAAGPPPNFGQRLVQNLKDYLLTGPDLRFSAPETQREPFVAGLLSGDLQAYGGVQAGRMGREQMEQRRADQAFKDRLTAALQLAQIGHLNAQSEALQHPRPESNRMSPIIDPVTAQVYGYDPSSNQLVPSALAPSRSAAPTPATPAPTTVTPAPSPQQLAFLHPKVKEPTLQERGAAGIADEMEAAVNAMEEITSRNPAVLHEVAPLLAAGAKGTVGKLISDFRGGLSPDANAFYNNYQMYKLNVTPLRGGSRPTQQLLDLEQQATAPAIGVTAENWANQVTAMRRLVQEARYRAGRAATPRTTTPTPQRPVTGAQPSAPASAPTRPAPAKPQYHPEFWRPTP